MIALLFPSPFFGVVIEVVFQYFVFGERCAIGCSMQSSEKRPKTNGGCAGVSKFAFYQYHGDLSRGDCFGSCLFSSIRSFILLRGQVKSTHLIDGVFVCPLRKKTKFSRSRGGGAPPPPECHISIFCAYILSIYMYIHTYLFHQRDITGTCQSPLGPFLLVGGWWSLSQWSLTQFVPLASKGIHWQP